MKNKNYIVVLLLLLSTACNDWLDISPATEKKREDMYSSQDGFRNVLIGAYIRMKTASLYGESMTCGTVEMLAQHWKFSSGSLGEYLNQYDYKASVVENVMGGIYNNLYKVIADVNGLLEQIDRKQGVFEKDNYELIKGEALAIRAFCHFDVLRLFGPMPDNLPAGPILPYVTTVSLRPNEKQNWTDFTGYLLADLQQAEDYFARVDPICSHSVKEVNKVSSGEDEFMGYRQMRMNYYAVCGLKARVYLWMKNTTEALKYARIVMDARDPSGEKMYRLGTSNDYAVFDYTLSTEHLLNLNVYNLSSTLGSSRSFEMDRNVLTSRLYEPGTTDIRFVNMWEEQKNNDGTHHYLKKYWQTEDMPDLSENSIPLIRLYEMYLIAMECGSLSEANTLYREMCIARNIPPVNITSAGQLEKILVQEYNKEFYGEGQAFYAYKRLAVEDILYAGTAGSVETYIIPLPLQETLYTHD